MPTLSLPTPDNSLITALKDASEARAWLATQPQAQPLRLLRALLHEVRSVDNCISEPVTRLEVLDALRGGLIEAESSVIVRYTNKPLPLLDDEFGVFETAHQLWHALAVAYLRAVPRLAIEQAVTALHRGAIALREVLHCHYLAGIEVDVAILRLLYEVLTTAESLGLQNTPVRDPDLRHLGESTVASDAAWAFLLHACDPYRFSPAQFAVANRAISRWCDLASFHLETSDDPRAKNIPLSTWLGSEAVATGGSKWLEVRPIVRKIRKRIEALESGEAPESLKLGRELSGAACVRLMRELDYALRPQPKIPGDLLDGTSIDLVFGNENLYLLVSGKKLVDNTLSAVSKTISHDRMAVFGFDNMVNRVDHAGDIKLPAEPWVVEDHWVLRAASAGAPIVAPLLVGIRPVGQAAPRLAVLFGLRQTGDGWLAANLRLLPTPLASGIQTVSLTGKPPQRLAVFFIPPDEAAALPASICLPAGSGMREGSFLTLEDAEIKRLRLVEPLERGSNFTRFTYKHG